MEIITFDSLAAFDRSVKGFYRHDSAFKNNKSSILKMICNPASAFYRNSTQKMIGVLDCGKIRCQCVLIKHRAYDALTVSFFEAEMGADAAVELMMDYAQIMGRELGCKRLEVSLDGHCNYSVGLLCGEATEPPLFGESYNPGYYHDFFMCDYTKITFKSYCENLTAIETCINDISQAMVAKCGDIRLEHADFKQFKRTMKRYTDLCNTIFTSERYYFKRAYDEDLELFTPMKPLLKPCNLIFAQKDDIDIGFILMYPDFNELVSAGKGAGSDTWVKHRLLDKPIHTMKIVEIGVLSRYRANGTILLLFSEALRQIKLHYRNVDRVVSSWILNENARSLNLTSRFAKQIHKRYAAYEKDI